MNKQNGVIGIDPGLKGSIVYFDGKNFSHFAMPVKEKEVNFELSFDILTTMKRRFGLAPVFLERAVSFGMGTKGAFNYGKGFAAVEIAIGLLKFSVIHVEPGKWAKEMHQGISSDLKPKVKSLVAIKRLYPKVVPHIPKSARGKLDEGVVDALLIAGYGLRHLGQPKKGAIQDFY